MYNNRKYISVVGLFIDYSKNVFNTFELYNNLYISIINY